MKSKIDFFLVSILAVIAFIIIQGRATAGESVLALPQPSSEDLGQRFAGFYEPVKVDISPQVAAYFVPLEKDAITNFSNIISATALSDSGQEKLLRNGIVALAWPIPEMDDIEDAYQNLKDMHSLPIFITSDSLLHLYHVMMDSTLRNIETNVLIRDLTSLSRAMQDEMNKRYKSSDGEVKEAFRKGLAFFSVGLKLLDENAEIPKEVEESVKWELKNIEHHNGFPIWKEAENKSIFCYSEDYSQYVPRGNYTRTKELKKYFKAMIWYGRMVMLIKGSADYGREIHQKALVKSEEARKQTILAAALPVLLDAVEIDGKKAKDLWMKIYSVTAFYSGFADDLTLDDYLKADRAVFGDTLDLAALTDPLKFKSFQEQIACLRPPEIYSGTGDAVVLPLPGEEISPEMLDKALAKTAGLRLFGQRYVADSDMMGRLISPSVGLLTGKPAFTTVQTPIGPVRGFPRGLDVMAVLGSDRALKMLTDLGDDQYENYQKQMTGQREKFGAIKETEWNRNLYGSLLYSLKALINPVSGEGWPTFMTTSAWQDKQLNAALGSWTALRHDMILYAKEIYGSEVGGGGGPPEYPVEGYVEPVPEFYARLLTLTRMTEKGLSELKVMDVDSMSRLEALDKILARLINISQKELKNQVLENEDYNFISEFGENLRYISRADLLETSIIADVHTDPNSQQVLEEATGYLNLLLVAYNMPQGHIVVGAGPIYSYYEFKQPMQDRLTDEKWQEMLRQKKAPAPAEWTDSFRENK